MHAIIASLLLLAANPLTSWSQSTGCSPITNKRDCDANVVIQGVAFAAHMGHSLAGWRDWDGDGETDIVLGGQPKYLEEGCDAEPPLPYPSSDAQRAWVALSLPACLQAAGGCSQAPFPVSLRREIREAPGSDSRFGFDACYVGDLNVSSIAPYSGHEFAISAPTRTNVIGGASIANAGTVYVFFLESRSQFEAITAAADPELGVPGVRITAIRGGTPHGWFGASIAAGGNVIGTLHPDLVVGAPGPGVAPAISSEAFVVDGLAIFDARGSVGLPPGELFLDFDGDILPCPVVPPPTNPNLANCRRIATLPEFRLGYAVSGLGDLNGDGYNEIAASAPAVRIVCVLDPET
jgi:hypothetical protein